MKVQGAFPAPGCELIRWPAVSSCDGQGKPYSKIVSRPGVRIRAGVRKPEPVTARRFFVRGRVQAVGFRYFVERAAGELEITGYARNLADGRVEVYAVGAARKLDELAGLLWQGPRWAEVRGVEEQDAPVLQYSSFRIDIG